VSDDGEDVSECEYTRILFECGTHEYSERSEDVWSTQGTNLKVYPH
jgi:hypothetical protein